MTLDTLHAAPADPTAPKAWWQSLTIWFNVISAVVVIGGVFVDPTLGFDPRVVAVAAAILTAGNAALRIIKTNSAILGTPAAAQAQTAKENIALHAAITAGTPALTPEPTVEDLGRMIESVRQKRDDYTALLDKAAAMASAPPATVPPSPATLSAVMPPPVTAP